MVGWIFDRWTELVLIALVYGIWQRDFKYLSVSMRDINWNTHNKNKCTEVQWYVKVLSSDSCKHLWHLFQSPQKEG